MDATTEAAPIPYGMPYRLKFPVDQIEITGGEEVRVRIETVTLRRPTGADLEIMDRFGGRRMALLIEMVAACSGLPVSTVRKMDGEDLLPLGLSAMQSLSGGLPTGGSL